MGAGVSTGVGAAATTAVALGAAAGSRMLGGCYAICQQGEACNPHNGLCETMPCRGNCAAGSRCEQDSSGERCVDAAISATKKGQSSESSALPAVQIGNKPPVPAAARP